LIVVAPHAGHGHYRDRTGFLAVSGGKEGGRMPGALSTIFTVTLDVVLSVAAVVWLGCAFRTYRDARRRCKDALPVWGATLLGLVPLAGPLLYLLVRPPETLAERRVQRAELRVLEAELARQPHACPLCLTAVEDAFLVCPVCTTRLKEPCSACQAPLAPLWLACPYCGTHTDTPASVDLDAALTAEAAATADSARTAISR
jgi:hypothetical protein